MKEQNVELNLGPKALESLLKNSNDLIILTDSQRQIEKVSSRALQLSGYHLTEILHQPIESLIHPKDLETFKAFLSGHPKRCQARILTKEGKTLWLLWSLTALQEQNVFYFAAMDLTEIKQKSQSIAASESKLQRVLNDGKIGYWEVTFSTGELFISDNIREWWGLAPDQKPDNEYYLNLLHPDDQPEIMKAQNFIVETRQPYEIIHRTRKPDGNYIWIQGTGHPMFNEEGELIGLMGTSMDITQKMELEAALKLQQAKMLSSSRLSAIGEMASAMAHEINNPLAIIYLNSESLRENHSNPEFIKARAEKISQTAMRIARIVRSLRTLSRDGDNDPFEPTSAQRVLDDALEICRQKLFNEQIDFKVQSSTEDLMIKCRPTQISQVLLNLINNAYDAVSKLPVRWIEVSLSGSSAFVDFVVRDSGTGIDSSLHKKIFEPFYTTKEPTKGTGLGLSVSQSIVSTHSGTLQINAEANHTEFTIRFPRYSQKTLESQSQDSQVATQPEASL